VLCFVGHCLSSPLFFLWPLCCLSFIDLQLLVTPLVSSNSSYFFSCVTSWNMISTRYPIHNGKIALYIIICYKFVYFFIYILFVLIHLSLVWFKVFNAIFNNISVISWQSVLLVKETGVPGENHRPVTSHWQTLSHT
jgi:hypothetical protein